MVDLKTQIKKSADSMKDASTMLQAKGATALPSKCYEHWIRKARFHETLALTADILPVREKAWDVVQVVRDSKNQTDVAQDIIEYNGIEVAFSIARHLALISYVSVAWSIYDRLANVCGRLAAVAALSENPRQNPKACEDFLGKKDILGFSTHRHIQDAYAWPLKVTYKIRNWLVHEGYEEGGTPMFKGGRIADGFTLHNDTIEYLETCCDYNTNNGKIDKCCLQPEDECWPTPNLLLILEKYHREIDTMFEGLVKWAAESFVGQITAFTERDKAGLASAAAARVS